MINTKKPFKIYADVVEAEALAQFEAAMQLDCVVQGALMPDAHTGYTLPIGAVIATTDVVFPSFVGYDIGCGVCAIPTTFSAADVQANAEAIFEQVSERVPMGFKWNKSAIPWPASSSIDKTPMAAAAYTDRADKQIGTLGSGNHFIEIGVSEAGVVWIITHSGSRGLGHAVATHYMKLASPDGKAREGLHGLLVDSEEGRNYLKDMNFCLEFALENRKAIVARVEAAMRMFCDGDGLWGHLINRNHNHAEQRGELLVHRKGATHAEDGMLGVVPGNMRDGSFIVRGKGCADSLWSSSHGAGRVLGRKAAKASLNLPDFQDSMKGVVANVSLDTLDESPAAYKDIFEVMNQQSELVDVLCHVRPIINLKG